MRDPDPTALVSLVEMEAPGGEIRFDSAASVPNHLLPHLTTVNYKLAHRRNREDPSYIDFQWRLAMLPYSLSATYSAYVQFTFAARKLLSDHENGVSARQIALNPTEAYPICFTIDAFLDAARRTQNALTVYLSAATRQSLPPSLSDLMKGLRKGRYSLPPAIADPLADYWQGYGAALKNYRDIAQHHALVASGAILFRSNDGTVGINLLLPSNPDVSSTRDLVWGAPPIHAQSFLRVQFKQLLGLCHYLTKLLAEALSGDRRQILGTYPRTPVVLGQPIDGHRPLSEAEVKKDVMSALQEADRLPLAALQL